MLLIDKDHKLQHAPLVATIGFFDGVHTGHRFLIDQVKEEAAKRGLPSAVITFPVHPRKVLQKDYQPALLCGFDEKTERLATTGVDYCVCLDFTTEISQLSAREFMKDILKDKLSVNTLVIGYDHRFGHNREDGFADYKRYGSEIGINVIEARELPGEEHVSSSRIRKLLAEGYIRKAAKLLSYNYTISGKIVEGFKVGRTIGFPTANIQVWETYKVIPAFGVYAVYVHVEGQRYDGMLYIGKRPTLHNGDNISIEVNLFNFDGDLYNKNLTAEFIDFVRPDEKFIDIDTLKKQIGNDKDTVISVIENYKRFNT
ncbi:MULTISPECIES: riboflavin biosynthesis protein RibF [Dysgonomonas]|uniref:Riboflavin biosynthesis protein n=1 Tax=Dysgonomonas gadei ATCC BAA-286 TaxID=742766 RepID=F5IW46_9BACT|nr:MULTISPECIES: riboflavin biosynthesis protein RibF [Dysgonomonas]EGK02846.1 riboflavin biosynthesis protein RibF [Dysgonomonas gadei ATCC BAA-286]MBF0648487.1 riboflavin biosynthesis protein RibF [Dysgonomonas sp. GY75]